MSMERKHKHLTYTERLIIERMLLKGFSKKEIAAAIGCCVRTIYYEIKRATYEHTNSDLTTEHRYAPEKAENIYRNNLKLKGRQPKILGDDELLHYIGTMVAKYKYSPKAIILQIKADERFFHCDVRSVNTIYSAISKGYVDRISLEDLPRKGRNKRKKKRIKVEKQAPPGVSIERRDKAILKREDFGHWEMDCLIGKATNRKTVLVLTERKTRYEIIEVLKSHTTYEVVKALNRIEKRFGRYFYDIFKTITVDNGSEFKDYLGMEKALYRKGRRTNVYYCHPQAPHERGSNENSNILIRRWLKRGENFDKSITRQKVKAVEEWLNFYPRSILSGLNSFSNFIKEVDSLGYQLAL